jgi:AhpD family alkylhydroperoxidase
MRIPAKPLDDYSFILKPFFKKQNAKFGQVLEPTLLWGRNPELYLAFQAMYRVLDRKSSPVDPVLRSLTSVRIAQLCHCDFCVDFNARKFRERGGDGRKLTSLPDWRTSDLFSPKERTVLAYAEAMTANEAQAMSATLKDVAVHFEGDAIVDLTGYIAFQNMSARFNSALGAGPIAAGTSTAIDHSERSDDAAASK